ncbi:hypothetical protein RCC89_00090 [Cytophagaceae bacterium ABcell3]|nr:hypothetical protein RCC89_00090 [Cytophagaceae bacterium ABcell3]
MKFIQSLNLFQTLAMLGIIFSIAAQFILSLINKHVDNFWAVYPTWIFVFIFGTIVKKYVKPDDHHH